MSKTTGPDGVMQIYPDKPGRKQVYMGNNADRQIFNVSYGSGSVLPYEQKQEGSLVFYNTTGSKITYNSGSPPGRTTRIDVYPAKGLYQNNTQYAWNNLPNNATLPYLFKPPPDTILNEEFTTFIRVHGDLGTHQAYSHKLGGRNDDSIRSLIEMVYPTATHSTIQVNYNYAHFPYVNAKPNLFGSPLKIADNGKWIGVKTIHWVNPDGKSSHWEMWYNLEPFDSTGKPQHDWQLGATFEDHGTISYAVNGVPVPLIWAQEKSVCRVDGFQNVDFCLFSDREIDPTAQPSTPKPAKAKKAEIPTDQGFTVLEADPLESVEEAAEREKIQKQTS